MIENAARVVGVVVFAGWMLLAGAAWAESVESDVERDDEGDRGAHRGKAERGGSRATR